MTVLVTGAAGFIGSHTCRALLDRGEQVVGLDNLNDYYDVSLKRDRLAQLTTRNGFQFVEADISDMDRLKQLAAECPEIDRIINLAAQAGVRYSLENPFAYGTSNLMGQIAMFEFGRLLPELKHLVYASSSSVYGGNEKMPFSIDDRVDHPVSLYAATKRAGELLAHTYSHLYAMPATGIRFFTVYGPWGRPDMAAFIFVKAILAGEPIRVFNQGDMKRDFTYVDDAVAGLIAAMDRPPPPDSTPTGAPHKVYNIGNNSPEHLTRFIEVLEEATGKKAIMDLQPMQPGDVESTFADIEASRRDLGFEPTTPIEVGLARFVEWYRGYYGV